MDIQAALQPITLPVKAAQLNLSQWFLGQILNATVTDRKSANTVTLQIQNQQIEAKITPDKTLNVGSHLKLVVEKLDTPVLLRVLQQNFLKATYETKQQLLRESIPKQASMEKLTSVLNHVSSNVKAAIKILPTPIEQQINKLIEHLPEKTNLNNETGLKAAIKNSGIFLESKLMDEVSSKVNLDKLMQTARLTTKQALAHSLAKATSPKALSHTQHKTLAKDLKNNLLQLSEAINKHKQISERQNNNLSKFAQTTLVFASSKNMTANTKSENIAKAIDLSLKIDTETISKQIESSIARIEVNQSKGIITHDSQTPVWSIEMPIKDNQDIDLLELNIQSDKDTKSEITKKQLWTANLKIDFENIGTVSARLSVINKEVNATLWSENKILNELISDNLFLLNKQIEVCGLSTGKIVCLEEIPIDQDNPFYGNNLINITI